MYAIKLTPGMAPEIVERATAYRLNWPGLRMP